MVENRYCCMLDVGGHTIQYHIPKDALCRALWLGRVLMRAVGVTLNTFSGSITYKEGLSVTLYILEHLLVEARGP